MSKKVCVIGHFGEGKTLLNGQTIKTKIITEELQRQLGDSQILKIDTHGGFKVLLKAPFHVFKAFRESKNIVIFPAHNGLRVYAPLLSFFKFFFKNKKLHYVVIGGWLPQFLLNKKILTNTLKRFDGIYVETSIMKKSLEKYELQNVYIMPNCKNIPILSEKELVYPASEPYKLCTFSRVMKEKGIEDAICAVKQVNNLLGRIACTLDIYGQIDSNQKEWFEDLRQKFPDFIRYCGCVDADKSVEILKDYYALLFPTHFYTEGIPGTIIDAYAAGVPVISAKWESFDDVVDEGKTGFGYEFGCCELLSIEINKYLKNRNEFIIKRNCIKKAEEYILTNSVGILIKNLN